MERIYHVWSEWECYPAGFYETADPQGRKREECEATYASFLKDTEKFKAALFRVISEWQNSCEHYLSNPSMNRIAWLGQASLCIATGIPSAFRSGFALLTKQEQEEANAHALFALNVWLHERGEESITAEQAGVDCAVDLY